MFSVSWLFLGGRLEVGVQDVERTGQSASSLDDNEEGRCEADE